MSEQGKRPRQVTTAGIVAGAASAVMLLSVGNQLAGWNSLETQQKYADLGKRLGLSLDQVMGSVRVGLFVAAALAAAALVLTVFALRRDKGARVALSVVAVPLFLVSVVVDVFLGGFVAAGAALLWSEPARDWYAGRAPRERHERGGSLGPAGPSPTSTQPVSPGPAQPAAPSAPQTSAPPPTGAPVAPPVQVAGPVEGPAPYAGTYAAPSTRARPARGRPTQVVLACATTWVISAMVAVFTLVSLVGTLVPGAGSEVRDQVRSALQDSGSRREFEAAGVTAGELLLTAQVLLVVVLVWAVAAVLLGVLAYRGHGWARVTLVVSASAAGVLGLLGVFGALPLLLVTLGCAFTVARLLSAPASRWYAERAQRDSP